MIPALAALPPPAFRDCSVVKKCESEREHNRAAGLLNEMNELGDGNKNYQLNICNMCVCGRSLAVMSGV